MSLVFDKKININRWNKILESTGHSAFFQSLEWGEIEKNNGKNVETYEIKNQNKTVGVLQVFEINARRGHFLHVRHGPILLEWNKKNVREVTRFLKDLAKKKNVSFIRISPLILEGEKKEQLFLNEGFVFSPVYNLDAENRWVLDLGVSAEQILSQMRKTTRYLIKKGEKEGIEVVVGKDVSDFKKFEKIYKETALTKGFIPHKLVREEFDLFNKKGQANLYLAFQGKKILAGALVIYSQNSAIYRHGATSLSGRKTSASYLIQWKAINDAKEKGCLYYDFWGIAKDENIKNPWYGLSSFKKGFGGSQVDYLHSLDLRVSWRYWITFGIDLLTKIKKGHFLR